jgi:flagellar basal-body rod protein FlgF
MDSGYFAATAGLIARTQALDTAAANLANAQTPGFRAERDYFRSVLLGSDALPSQLGDTVNDLGVLGGDRLDMDQGAFNVTGNPLDLAIEGEGFFELQTRNGPRFTRDGGFRRSLSGVLVNADGDPVISREGRTIRLPQGEVRVGRDGGVSVAGALVGSVGIFTFPLGTELTAEGGSRYRSPGTTVAIATTESGIRQGTLEMANQDTIQSSLDLIIIQRQAEMMQRALTMFHTEFNKIASEDLPRV